ncbi:MAG: zf-HC2 domain-containing protein [Actinomycetota bacterium]|nr:zf-HC2 domain-containing protein [Actinomycetota bacterium]
MPDADELSCRELVELVTDYLEGALPPPTREAFEEHLEICEGCRAYLQQMELTIQMVGALSEESIPAPAKAELLDAFRDWKRNRGMKQREL